jgi:cobalt-precorrin-5B (C1)-methyltransferase
MTMDRKPEGPLRRGWTTGACATAAAKAAYTALLTGVFPDPVTIRLPRGQTPSFPLAHSALDDGLARAGVVKDAGDDPDVTHGALVVASVHRGESGSGITFFAGEGVGTVTRHGLPLPPGEPAINPAPRAMIGDALKSVAAEHGVAANVAVTIAIPGGERLAQRTWNPRLGIVGGLSVLGTTGIVIPYSCSAWIHAIRQGIDVARAAGIGHVAGATGKTSEVAVRKFHGLGEDAIVDMGDFVGGMLKYIARHPVKRVTVAGGFAKLTKLAQGHLDLHSARSEVDFERLADMAARLGAANDVCTSIRQANTAAEALGFGSPFGIADAVARAALDVAQAEVGGAATVDVLVIDRQGGAIGHAGP